MPTLMQKIRLAIRGWNRRRDEKEKEFLQRNAWGAASAGRPVETGAQTTSVRIDVEGLTVAYLDDSGHFQHYLDVETGDVIDTREPLAGDRYRRVPPHRAHDQERRDFIMMLDDSGARARLTSAPDFRTELARDRALERAWYNFRNDRAIAAIENWLRELGLK